MKKLLAALLAVILLCGCCSGCLARDNRKFYTFTDDLGRTVTVREPEKVAALLGSFAEVWHLAGGTLLAASDDAFQDFDLPLTNQSVNLGSTKRLSLALLLQLQPDFVIASANSVQHLQWKDTLEKENIPVAYFDVNTFEDYLRMLKICTNITGCADRYETYGTSQQTGIDAVRGRIPQAQGPSVLVLRASAGTIRAKTSDSMVLSVMLKDLGCVNVADTPGAFVNYDDVTMDDIVKLDPDFIFAVQAGDDEIGMQETLHNVLGSDPRWKTLTAVKNDRAHLVERELFHFKPNSRWAQAYETLAGYIFGA